MLGALPTRIPGMRWQDFAACKGLDPDMFFPERGVSTRHAKAACQGCPVRYVCLAENLFENTGVWGGMSENERRAYRSYLRNHHANSKQQAELVS